MRWFAPRWPTVQIEITTTCQASCVYCPRTSTHLEWHDRFMSEETFDRIAPFFPQFRYIHLQGWGEPLLHPRFLSMVQRAKAAGCRVGTTTNSLLLDDRVITRLITSGVDVLAVSVAGLQPTHDRLRPDISFAHILKTLDRICRIRSRLASPTPHLHLAWLCIPEASEDVLAIPEIMTRHGVRETVISGISLVSDPSQEALCFAGLSPEKFQSRFQPVRDVLDTAFEHGLSIHAHIPFPTPRRHCPEPVQSGFVLCANGDIAPCVMGGLPVSPSRSTHCYHGHMLPLESLTFGNMKNNPLPDIWKSKKYKQFRKNIHKETPPPRCAACYKRHILPLSPFPELPSSSISERLDFLRRYGDSAP